METSGYVSLTRVHVGQKETLKVHIINYIEIYNNIMKYFYSMFRVNYLSTHKRFF